VRLGTRNLIEEIQDDALNPGVPLSTALRKLVALGGEAGSSELREWASLELEGYTGHGDVDLPEYRRVPATIQLDGATMTHAIRGQQIGPHHFPADIRDTIKEEQPLPQPIGTIESMISQARANGGFLHMAPQQSQILVSLMNYQNQTGGIDFQQITAIYWAVSVVALEGVVEHVRSKLVRLVAEMRAGMPAETSLPTPELADNAVRVVVHGRKSTVNVTTAQSTGSGLHHVVASPPATRQRTPWWRGLWGILVGLAAIIGTLVTIAIWQGWAL
jgi:hypothetical protein